MELFVSKGFAATKLEDVAKAAGVSKGLPYLYFKNKEELFKAVIVESIGEPLVRANDMVDAFEGTTDELLRALVAKFREFAESPLGGVIKLILAEAGNFPDVARFYCSNFDLRGRALFAKMLQRGVDRGEFGPIADIDMTAIIFAQPLAMHAVWLRSIPPAGRTQRKPRWLLPESVSPLPRVPTMYRVQYWSAHRNEPPRCTRFLMPGSAGSNDVVGPCGFRATPPADASRG